MFCSAVDKAHLRLASAQAVLRLSRQWDHKIPPDLFYLTLRVSEVLSPARAYTDTQALDY